MSKNNKTKKEMENVIETICAAVNEENKENNNKKENKEMKENKNNNIENKDNEERKTKNDLDWLTGGTANNNKTYSNKSKEKITNKIVKINSNIFNIKLETMNKVISYKLIHKQTKKGAIKVTIESEQFDTIITKLMEVENDVEYRYIKIIKGEETIESEDDYVAVDGIIIPLEILINPVFDFYITNKKLRRELVLYTEGNIKINGDKITLDARLRKDEYMVDSRNLSIEELDQFVKEDEDNKLAVSLEFARRSMMEEGVEVSNNNGDEKVKDDKEELSAPDKIIAIIEDIDVKQKEKMMKAIDDNKSYEVLLQIIADMKDAKEIINILKDKNSVKEIKAVLKLNDDQINNIINPTKNNDLINSKEIDALFEKTDGYNMSYKAIVVLETIKSKINLKELDESKIEILANKLEKLYKTGFIDLAVGAIKFAINEIA
jgi:hypothetical protein